MHNNQPKKRYYVIFRASMRAKSGKIVYASAYGKKAFAIKIYY